MTMITPNNLPVSFQYQISSFQFHTCISPVETPDMDFHVRPTKQYRSIDDNYTTSLKVKNPLLGNM